MKELDMALDYLKEIDEIKASTLPEEDKTRITGKRITSIHRYITKIEQEIAGYVGRDGKRYELAPATKEFYTEQLELIKAQINPLMS